MSKTEEYDFDVEVENDSEKFRKGREMCPKEIFGCSLNEVYYNRFAKVKCKVHDVNAAKNCFVKRVRDQIWQIENGNKSIHDMRDMVTKSHFHVIDVAASYLAHSSSELDMKYQITEWYNKQFNDININIKSIYPLFGSFNTNNITKVLSKACRENIEFLETNQERYLDNQLKSYKNKK
jgi:hypothetical protein